MQGQRKTEIGGKAGGDFLPTPARVRAAIDATVVLLEEKRALALRLQQLMHALAVLGPFFRQEFGACPLVGGPPGRAVVGGAEYANGRYPDKHLAGLRVIDH